MFGPNPQVDNFIAELDQWKAEFEHFRALLLDCGLEEGFKWKQPVYMVDGKNLFLLANFKNRCALSFFNGFALSDPHQWLEKPGKNSLEARIINFTSETEVLEKLPELRSYIFEAVEAFKSGVAAPKPATKPGTERPAELLEAFAESEAFEAAFDALTPGRQRGYLIFFTGAKQSKTVRARIEKFKPRILDGYGMNDCTCGYSKRMPTCDGSHKHLVG